MRWKLKKNRLKWSVWGDEKLKYEYYERTKPLKIMLIYLSNKTLVKAQAQKIISLSNSFVTT